MNYTCPECNGEGTKIVVGLTNPYEENCFYCKGYGLVSEEDTFEAFYKEKQ